MATTAIDTSTIILNHLLRHISIETSLQFNEKQLCVEFDEEKILNALSTIASEYSKYYKEYTGEIMKSIDIDKIVVHIGEYKFSGVPVYEKQTVNSFIGYKKEVKE